MKLVVTARELRYAGKSYTNGESFEASEKDAKVLKLIRKAADAPERAPVRKVAETRALKAESEIPRSPPEAAKAAADGVDSETPPTARSGSYSTRRLKAED